MNHEELAYRYALAKQLPALIFVMSDYGPIELDDEELQEAVADALRPIIEKRLQECTA